MWRTITTGWDFFRLVRLALGIAALVQAVILQEWVLALAGAFIGGMALANMGCGVNGCRMPQNYTTPTQKNMKDISYEELDNK